MQDIKIRMRGKALAVSRKGDLGSKYIVIASIIRDVKRLLAKLLLSRSCQALFTKKIYEKKERNGATPLCFLLQT